MLSAITKFERSYPAMLLTEQLADQRFAHSGPLVLGTAPFNFQHLQKIGTELSHDVLNPTHVPL